jgi:hypothetical protein
MKCPKLVKNRRGISSLFVTIYITMLAFILISTLFIAVGISRWGVTEYLKVEQERMQESIRLFKLIIETDYVDSIIINNTGAISVRIRALYVDQVLICDPSTLEGDSYIAPKEALTITLSDFSIDFGEALSAQWTATTERGTKSSETGINLWAGSDEGYPSSNKFYFGPLMILFDMFHWRSGSGEWKSGWSIPKGTDAVTWRILLTNVDKQAIVLKDDSCFTLVGNDNIPHSILAWYIDPTLSSMTLEPGGWYLIYYKWGKPYSAGGASPQSIVKFQVETTCKNFLTFTGSFADDAPFGQTIPFEAVLVTD